MRSTRRGQFHSRSARSRPAAPMRAAPVRARARPARAGAAATAADVAARREQPGLALDDHGAHARVVGRDHRQAGRHRLDQDDAERLRRLGGEQEEVAGAQHVRQLGVGNGAEEVDAVADAALAALARSNSSTSSPPPATTMWTPLVAQLREGVDRDVEALEVVRAVEGRDERGDDRRRPGCRGARAGRSRPAPGENSSASTPFGISISFAGLALAGAAQVRDRVRVVRLRARRRGRRRGSGPGATVCS